MGLPFTRAEFFAVFAAYNEAVWPAQLALGGLAIVAAWAARTGRGRAAAWALAILWAWAGVVYHWGFFRAINPAATLFAALFLTQALLFAGTAVRGGWGAGAVAGWRGAAGWALVLFAMVVYPLWGLAAGHEPRALPVLGVPCPTTILTLGVLLWIPAGPPRVLLVVPLLWSVVGGSAAFVLGVPQDLGLPVAAAISLPLLRSTRRGPAA